ncbi:LysM peptidoglycan-binding domain-containing protein [uncultured Pontibacter sp.]|uniref:LysM peptidoglycan-binding domain-containing protein n=1 Tax=uncultured Pontibacter sp. TaxID=453356 RepID=UPI0026101335|nr:LysM peptidoglycan-binding domain-containing protein [uncultured Pontibacter sp.]
MKTPLPFLFLLLLPLLSVAQGVTVPQNIYFGDIHLRISPRAQDEIQKKVDALHRSPKYFQNKVELADAYFPLIERTFQEEGVPDDFKYLALQESGLRGDAVSTSNAVGYWQFKKEAAIDFNLRMDHLVDERKHIIEASRGAARYFKRSNNYYNNWLNALLSYYHGYTGAKAYTKESDKGSKKMDITEKTDPYLLTFLAHKVAYDSFVGKSTQPAVSLRELRATPGQSLADIALAHQTDPSELEKYNKWLLGSSIPSDKDYYVMLPVRHNVEPGVVASAEPTLATPSRQASPAPAAGSIIKRNNLNAIIAGKSDTKDKLAIKAGISTRQFLRYNDLRDFDKIEEGTAYYIQPKRLNADTEFHVVQHGESMQEIAQLYGIRMDYLQFKNRMKRAEVPVPGRVLWLQKRRPAKVAVEVRDVKQAQPASKAAVASQEKAAPAEQNQPQENFFTRFKNSLKRFKHQPEQTVPASEPTPDPVDKKEAAIEEVAIEEVVVEEVPVKTETAIAIPVMKEPAAAETKQEATPEPTVKPKAETKPIAKTEVPKSSAVLYPGKKPQETKAKAEEAKTAEEVIVEEEESAEWAAGLGEEVFVGFSGGEMEVEAEELIVESTVETTEVTTAVKEGGTPKTTPTKAEPAKTAPTKAAPVSQAVDPKPTTTNKPTLHVVKQGESLWGISRLYAVTVNDITTWNNLGDAPIKIGQELVIAEPLTVPAGSDREIEAKAEGPTAEEKTEIHTVASGESLYVLSRKYNVTVNELKAWNNLSSSALSIGQELRVTAPANATGSNEDLEETPAETFKGTSTQHTVVSGESLYQISRKYGVTIKDIMQWNGKSDFNVKPGDKLVIKKK